MTEKRLRSIMVSMLAPFGAFAVENPVCPGTPDICTSLGWIELKCPSVAKISVRKTQLVWMRDWIKHGGTVWVLSVIRTSWFLHTGQWIVENEASNANNADLFEQNARFRYEGYHTHPNLKKGIISALWHVACSGPNHQSLVRAFR